MPAGELSSIFSHVTRTATAREFEFAEYQLSKFLAPAVATRCRSGDTAQWDILKADRDKAAISAAGAPSKRVAMKAAGRRIVRCLHSPEHVMLDGDALENLRAPGSEEADAEFYVADEQQHLTDRHQALREYMAAQMLAGSAAYTQDGVSLTIDYEVATLHKPTAAVSWGTITTDIPADIETWKQLIRKDSGREPAHAWMNQGVMDKLLNNTKVQKFLGEATMIAEIGQTGRITRLNGLTLHVYDNGYVPSGGSFTKYIPDDKLILMPEPDKSWVDVQEGSTRIKPLGVDELVRVFGRHAYVMLEGDPAGYKLLEDDIFIWTLPVPDAIVYADVTP